MTTEYKPFFSLFKYPKEKVLDVVKSLTFEERKLLIKKYGIKYNNIKIVYNLTEKENKIINERIIRKIKLRLKKIEEDMCLVSISDIFPSDDLNDIKVAMKDENLLTYFQNLFGRDLNYLCYTYRKEKSNIDKYNIERVKKRLLKNKGIDKVRIIKPFVSLFIKYKKEDETYEEFESRLKDLVYGMKDKYKKVIYMLYNEDLNNIILKHPASPEIRKIFSEAYSVILKKLVRDLQKEKPKKIRKYKSILTLFNNGTTLNEIREKLELNDRIYMLSKKKYGEDLNIPSNIGTLTTKENHELYEYYYKINGIIFKEKKVFAYNSAKNMINSPLHKAFSEIYGCNLAYGLIIYINFSDYLSLNEICHLSEIKIEELLETIEKYETGFKRKLSVSKHDL